MKCCSCNCKVPDASKFCNKCGAPQTTKQKGYYVRPDGLHEKYKMVMCADGIKRRKAFRGWTDAEVDDKMIAFEGIKEKGRPFKEVAESWKEETFSHLANTTQHSYETPLKRLKERFDGKGIMEITQTDIKQFYAYLAGIKGGLTRKTVRDHGKILNAIFKFEAERIGYYNPVKDVKLPEDCKPSVKRGLPSKADIETIEACIDVPPFGLLMFTIMNTGCRRGEALALRKRDIDYKNGRVHINKSIYWDKDNGEIKEKGTKIAKNGVDEGARSVKLDPDLADVLQPILAKLKPDDRIFKIPGRSQLDNMLADYRKKIGISCTLHQLRHYFCTILYEGGVKLKSAAKMMGHIHEGTTADIYTHLREEEQLLEDEKAFAQMQKKSKEKKAERAKVLQEVKSAV
jgi:integrase